VLCLTATAWACIGLSTLGAGSSSPAPGQQLEVRGEGYASNGGNVSVHLDSPKGQVVAMTAPENDGGFRTTFTVPHLRGEHVLVAVQRDARGSVTKTANMVIDVAGTGDLASGTQVDDPAVLAAPSGPPGFAVAGPLGLTALALLAAATIVVVRGGRGRGPACA
jgi:hypothetical protein